ncbi:MAG: HD domain-containing protein [Firmicutes bacterium]|nr:HD domain-containing protein [Bacillota bacterium]
MTAEQYRELMRKRLDAELYEHSLATAETAAELAVRYGSKREKAYLAGLVHDYGKRLKRRQLLEVAESYNLKLDRITMGEAKLLHAPVGAALLTEELKINNRELLNAVSFHTTGSSGMTLLARVLYLADCIEPGRTFDGVDKIRELAAIDLEQALLAAVDKTICSVVARGLKLHPRSVAFRNSLLDQMKK